MVAFDRWIAWSADNPRPFASSQQGVGSGEEMFAWEIDGQVVGPNMAFDIICNNDNTRWEIKRISDDSMCIRTGIDATAAFKPYVDAIKDVARQFADAFAESTAKELIELFSLDAEKYIEMCALINFVKVDVPNILRGTISHGRMLGGTRFQHFGLMHAIKCVTMLKTSREEQTRQVIIAKKKHRVDAQTFAQIGQLLGMTNDEMGIDDAGMMLSKLTHSAFDDPDAFLHDNWTSVKPSIAFDGITGVVFVKEDGFYAIAPNKINGVLTLDRFSADRPNFNVHI